MPSPKNLAFMSHPYALYVKRPNCDGWFPSNSLGYAGKREVSRERSRASVRIYCVGGSTTEAHDPKGGPDASWPGTLQDVLSERFPEVRIECINAGAAGPNLAPTATYTDAGFDLTQVTHMSFHERGLYDSGNEPNPRTDALVWNIWAQLVLSATVPVEETTWGSVKDLYKE